MVFLCDDNAYRELVPEEVTYKRYSSNNNGRYRNCSSCIDISIALPFRLFDFFFFNEKILVSDPKSSIHRSIEFSFIEFEIWPNRIRIVDQDRFFYRVRILENFLDRFSRFIDKLEEIRFNSNVFWINLNNNRIINLNTCRMFKRINPFVMILSESWKLFKLLLKIHIIEW